MNTHPYLRAYMAGIVIPTIFLLLIFASFCVLRFGYNVDVPVERVLIFPLALVPNFWGVWNILYVALRPQRRLPLGIHGALLPALLLPVAFFAIRALNAWIPDYSVTAFWLLLPWLLVVYYLLWKYLVGFFNHMLEIA